MGAKVSSEMLEARRLIESGKTAYAAAPLAKITRQAITRSKWYKDFMKAKEEAEKGKSPA